MARLHAVTSAPTAVERLKKMNSLIVSEPCYICGKKCDVMQSMMHAYTDIKVCGDCMIEHLYPFIESKKSEIGGMAASLQPQHALPGCKAWIDYDAVTRSLLIYFDGKPVESYAGQKQA